MVTLFARFLWWGHAWSDGSCVHLMVHRWWKRPSFGRAIAMRDTTADERSGEIDRMVCDLTHGWLLRKHPMVAVFLSLR